jgi:uncharacterized membrane protein YvbJ
MALIDCPECKQQVSEHAENCPHCGLKLKTLTAGLVKLTQKLEEIKQDPAAFKAKMEAKRARNNPNMTIKSSIAVVAALVIVGWSLAYFSAKHEEKTPPSFSESKKKHPEVGQLCKTKENYLFANTPEALEQAEQLKNDKTALIKLLDQGEVGILKKGVVVYYDNVKWNGMIKIRPKGSTEGVWTSWDAVEPL